MNRFLWISLLGLLLASGPAMAACVNCLTFVQPDSLLYGVDDCPHEGWIYYSGWIDNGTMYGLTTPRDYTFWEKALPDSLGPDSSKALHDDVNCLASGLKIKVLSDTVSVKILPPQDDATTWKSPGANSDANEYIMLDDSLNNELEFEGMIFAVQFLLPDTTDSANVVIQLKY